MSFTFWTRSQKGMHQSKKARRKNLAISCSQQDTPKLLPYIESSRQDAADTFVECQFCRSYLYRFLDNSRIFLSLMSKISKFLKISKVFKFLRAQKIQNLKKIHKIKILWKLEIELNFKKSPRPRFTFILLLIYFISPQPRFALIAEGSWKTLVLLF